MENTYHLAAIISFVRHGEKDKNGTLTSLGLQQAQERGLKMRHAKGQIYYHHSGVDRVKQTAKAIVDHLHFSPTDPIRSSADHGANHPEMQLDELHYLKDPKIPSDYFKNWGPVDETTATKRIQEYLNYHDKSPKFEDTPSPKELAQRVTRIIIKQLDKSLSTNYQVKENFINTTHEPVIMSFLYYFLHDFKPKNSSFVEQIGGSVSYTEGFDINVYQTPEDNTHVYCDFRELLKIIEIDKLKEFLKS